MAGDDYDNRSWKKAYKWIKKAIDSGEFEAGAPLHENALVQSIGLSRTPIREALRKLEESNYVKIIPARGAFVSEISLDDMREIYEIRKLLEPFAGLSTALMMPDSDIDRLEKRWNALNKKAHSKHVPDLTIVSATDLETHLVMLKYAHNKRITEIISSYHAQIQRMQMLSAQYLSNLEQTIREHLELLACMRERDPKKFRDLLYEHIVASEANIMRDYYIKE